MPKHPKVVVKRECKPVIDHVKTGIAAKQYREAREVTQADVAAELKVVQPYISALEFGRGNWNEQLLERYCAAVDKKK